MTTFGIDVSHFQDRLQLGSLKRQGYHFVIAKCTQGTGFVDSHYDEYRREAQAAGQMFAAYHFLEHGNGAAQAAHMARHIGDKSIPVMIDAEAGGKATLADCRAFKDACTKLGLRVTLLYFPESWWAATGRPSLKGWGGVHRGIVEAAYPSSRHDLGSALYPGDKSDHEWGAYGGVVPTLAQFASTGELTGYSGNVDVDAFRGSLDELKASGLFKDYGTKAEPAKVDPAPKHHPTKTPTPAPVPTSRGKVVDQMLNEAPTIKGGGQRAKVRAAVVKLLQSLRPIKKG